MEQSNKESDQNEQHYPTQQKPEATNQFVEIIFIQLVGKIRHAMIRNRC